MLEAPHITRVGVRQTAVICLTIPRSEIQSVMDPGAGTVGGSQGIRVPVFGPDTPVGAAR